MTVTPSSFRTDFPEFGDVVAYPDSAVAFWLAFAAQMLVVERWGEGSATASSPPTTLYDIGLELFAAHNFVLQKQAADSAAAGAAPGVSQGPVSNKSVGPVSVGYDTQSALEDDAGHWNLTTYGTRFLRLARMLGAGPVQITGNTDPGPLSGPAWPGPITGLGWGW